jgi:hypothetical protein
VEWLIVVATVAVPKMERVMVSWGLKRLFKT